MKFINKNMILKDLEQQVRHFNNMAERSNYSNTISRTETIRDTYQSIIDNIKAGAYNVQD